MACADSVSAGSDPRRALTMIPRGNRVAVLSVASLKSPFLATKSPHPSG